MSMGKSIYLAGPDVFLQNALDVAERKKKICREFGFEGLFPIDQDESPEVDAGKIFQANRRLMIRADIGVFNLTPFRGSGADCGTAFELGFMFSMGKPVHAYIGTELVYHKRVAELEGPLEEKGGDLLDRSGLLVENFGLYDNLMLIESVAMAGGTIVARDEKTDVGLTAIDAFRECIKAISDGAT